MLCPELHSDARDQLEKLLNAAMAKETSERSKGLVKAADECGKLRAELQGQNKAHGATVAEIRTRSTQSRLKPRQPSTPSKRTSTKRSALTPSHK
jgi:hypothetical protein